MTSSNWLFPTCTALQREECLQVQAIYHQLAPLWLLCFPAVTSIHFSAEISRQWEHTIPCNSHAFLTVGCQTMRHMMGTEECSDWILKFRLWVNSVRKKVWQFRERATSVRNWPSGKITFQLLYSMRSSGSSTACSTWAIGFAACPLLSASLALNRLIHAHSCL